MARRPLLTEDQWARLLAPPTDEREIVLDIEPRGFGPAQIDLEAFAGLHEGEDGRDCTGSASIGKSYGGS
jgi:hypothetical protein